MSIQSRDGDFVLLKFRKGEDLPCGKVRLPRLTLVEVQEMAGLEEDNPMYDSFPVTSNGLLLRLQSYTDEALDGARFDYFLERD